MLGNLISAIMLTTAIGIGGPLNTSTDYQDVNVTETYEYETNEVNSIDDLVVGNIYQYTSENYQSNSVINQTIYINGLYNVNVIYDSNANSYFDVINAIRLNFFNRSITAYVDQSTYVNANSSNTNDFISKINFQFIYSGYSNNLDIQYITASDFLGEKTVTVTPIEYDGMFAIFTNFLYSRLFSGDVLTSMETTILGQTLTLGQWVSSSVAIVILCLIVFMLVKFVIWLFKIVGGAFLWK